MTPSGFPAEGLEEEVESRAGRQGNEKMPTETSKGMRAQGHWEGDLGGPEHQGKQWLCWPWGLSMQLMPKGIH